jgi:hypothetical protein
MILRLQRESAARLMLPEIRAAAADSKEMLQPLRFLSL